MNKCYYLILSVIIVVGCDYVDFNAVQFIEDPENGMLQSYRGSKAAYVLRYFPGLSTSSDDRLSDQFILDIRQHVAKVGDSTREDFYYAYSIEKDVFLIDQLDTIRPSLVHLEPGIHGRSQLRLLLQFPMSDNDCHMMINDRYGDYVKFIMKRSDIVSLHKKINRWL